MRDPAFAVIVIFVAIVLISTYRENHPKPLTPAQERSAYVREYINLLVETYGPQTKQTLAQWEDEAERVWYARTTQLSSD